MTGTGGFPQRMTRVDRAWLRMSVPTNLMMITGVLLFEEPLARDQVLDVLERRLLHIPRFRHRVVARGGRTYWEEDPGFDLGRHVLEETLPEPGDDGALAEVVNAWMSRPLDASRPLWQAHLLHNHRGGTAVFWRLQHSMGDGVALMLVLLSMTEYLDEADGELRTSPLATLFQPDPISAEEARRNLERVMPTAVKLLSGPAEALKSISRLKRGAASMPAFSLLSLRAPDPKTPLKGKLGIAKRAAWSRPIPLREVIEVREGLGGTINDVLTTALAGGLRRYLAGRGARIPRRGFRAIVPVSLRPLDEMASLGNQFGLVFLKLPVGLGDPRRRLAEVRRRMSTLKRSFEPYVALRFLELLGAMPGNIQKLAERIFGAKGTVVLSNVPGPVHRLYFSGKPVRSFIFWVPQSGNLGMGLSIASYAGEVRLGVATDAGLVPDPEAVVRGFEDEFEAMRELAAGRPAAS